MDQKKDSNKHHVGFHHPTTILLLYTLLSIYKYTCGCRCFAQFLYFTGLGPDVHTNLWPLFPCTDP